MSEMRYWSNRTTESPQISHGSVVAALLPRWGAIIFDHFGLLLVLNFISDFTAALAPLLWLLNCVVLQGITGASVGKSVMGLRLAYVPEDMKRTTRWTYRAPGIWRCFGRLVSHLVFDAPIFFLGFWRLWWDPRSQTFADTLASTVVVKEDQVTLLRRRDLR